MRKVKLMTDSGSDISYQDESRYDIRIIPFKVTLGGKCYISRKDFDNEKFYEMLEEFDEIPTTAQITPYEFLEIFEEYYENGYTDVINVSINSAGSGTHAGSLLAADMFFENHPEAKGAFAIYNIDSRLYSAGYGYPVVEAAKMLEGGAEPEEVVAYIKDWCARAAAYFVPYSLKYAAKSGRIPSVARYFGDALGVKPLMLLRDGKITVKGKVRGEKNVIPSLAERVASSREKGSPYCIIYGNCPDVRDELAAHLSSALGYPPADIYQIGAVITANAGPRVAGVVFRQK